MDGLPLVLREENTYRGIAGLYGRVIELFHFSWDEFDVSSGSCLFLHNSGKNIDEEILLNWNNKSYSVWVKEVELLWPPELKEGTIFANEGEKEPVLDEEMGLEEGEFWLIVEQNMGPEYAPDVEQSENPGEGEPIRHAGELTCPSSRKRPRNRRSPVSIESPSVQNQGVGSGRSFNIPPFPDLNNPAIGCPGPFDDSSTSVSDIPEENPEDGPGTLVPETKSVEGYANFDKDVAYTMEIGTCVGIQMEDFEAQGN
ncbi:hypothetical protein L1987_71316 [Smallanthus sonchifolius]|uniref:Uncharacterized protein n=1 Tax=Smallanthus sonchifolius TaxID=185202 RepID=A0ACB9ATF7_9ASTR|nr:hypothetical protein L1987_71316 [Smallanthus sonchifolius]